MYLPGIPAERNPVIPPRTAPRLDWVDTARGASILLVITYHAGLFATSVGLESNAWNVVNGASRVIRMPLFFFLSGMLAAGALRRPWPSLLRGRVTGNLYLYALWASLAFVLFKVIPYTREGAPRGLEHWAQSVFILPENGLWYLLALALFLVTAKALSRFSTAMVLTVSSAVGALASANLVASSFVWNNCLVLFVFFVAGTRLKDRTISAAPVLGRVNVALPLVVVTGGLALAAARADVLDVVGTRWAMGALAVLAGIAAAAFLAATWIGRILAVLGRDTLAIYVTHEILLAVLVLPMTRVAATSWADLARWVSPSRSSSPPRSRRCCCGLLSPRFRGWSDPLGPHHAARCVTQTFRWRLRRQPTQGDHVAVRRSNAVVPTQDRSRVGTVASAEGEQIQRTTASYTVASSPRRSSIR